MVKFYLIFIWLILAQIFFLTWNINPLTSPGERVTVFTSPYLSAGAPALGEAKGLIIKFLYINIML